MGTEVAGTSQRVLQGKAEVERLNAELTEADTNAGEWMAKERALREGIKALADEWADWRDDDWADQTLYRTHAQVLRALLAPAAAATTGEALCDGCGKVTTGIKATDDGRGQFCPTCLPEANWSPGDPCGSCGSTDTHWTPDCGATCNGCGRTDADEHLTQGEPS